MLGSIPLEILTLTFFDVQFASDLQFLTFTLEVVGLTLACIEVRFPRLAQRIVESFVSFEQRMERELKPFYQTVESLNARGDYRTANAIQVVNSWWVVTLALPLVFFGILQIGVYWRTGSWSLFFDLQLLLLLVAATMLAPLMYWLFGFVNRWVEGRAVGTFGILLAGLGVLGEGYQLITQLIAS